jgi:integrase
MASLFKRQLKSGYTWVLQWKEAGRIRTKHLGKIPKLEAERAKARLETELSLKKLGIFTDSKQIKLSELITEFIHSIQRDHAYGTVKLYKLSIESLIKHMGDVHIDSVGPRDLENWRNALTLAPTTINIMFRHLKAVFNKAVEWDYISKSPFTRIKQLKVDRTLPPVIPLEHIKAFFNIITDPRDKAYFLTLYYVGSRPTETFNLRWDDIDFDLNTITFRNDKLRKTKSRQDRIVYMASPLRSVLLDLPHLSDRPFDQFNYNYQPSKRMKYWLEKDQDLPNHYTPKYFRHTLATLLSTHGRQPIAKDILGHSNISVTDLYTHPNIEDQKSILDAIPSPLN